MVKRFGTLILSITLLLSLSFTGCSNVGNGASSGEPDSPAQPSFDPSAYIKSVDSEVKEVDGQMVAFVTVVISNTWKDIESPEDITLVKDAAYRAAADEAHCHDDVADDVTFIFLDEGGTEIDMNRT